MVQPAAHLGGMYSLLLRGCKPVSMWSYWILWALCPHTEKVQGKHSTEIRSAQHRQCRGRESCCAGERARGRGHGCARLQTLTTLCTWTTVIKWCNQTIKREYDNDNYFEITEELLGGRGDMGFWLTVRKAMIKRCPNWKAQWECTPDARGLQRDSHTGRGWTAAYSPLFFR